jgi:hypothetical protein
MLLKIVDSLGVQQTVIFRTQEAVVDHSGTIATTAVAQVLLDANTFRSGWIMQNRGVNPMYVNELGTATVGAGSFAIAPGATFPPLGFPVGVGAISVLGTAADVFTVREW